MKQGWLGAAAKEGSAMGDGQARPAPLASPQSCTGKVAVVTGASRGIGQAISLRLAAEGAKVALLGRGTSTRRTDLSGSLQEGLDRIAAVGGEAIALHADLDAPEWDATALVRQITRQFGRSPDILIHSAAAPREWGPGWLTKFEDMTFERFQRSVFTNVWGGWRMAQAVVPGMRAQGRGNIVIISSSAAAPAPLPTMKAYTAHMAFNGGGALYGGTKAFLDRVCTGAALELYPDNIAVNGLATTGAVGTPVLRAFENPNIPPDGSEPMEAFVEAEVSMVPHSSRVGSPTRATIDA
jgi:citronellol/citronellal dehydrogenase